MSNAQKKTRGPKWLFCGFSVVFGMFAVMGLFVMASGGRVAEADKIPASVGFATTCAILSGSFLIAHAALDIAAAIREKKDED